MGLCGGPWGLLEPSVRPTGLERAGETGYFLSLGEEITNNISQYS